MATLTIIPALNTHKAELIRCAAYCRVSSSSEDQLNSYGTQIRFYSRKFENSDTETLVDIYADEGITGTSMTRRDEFNRLMSDCRKGKIDRIYTKSISRFARNLKDCLQNVRKLKALGISVIFEKENIDTLRTTDEIIITILAGLAQEESVSLSQNLQWGIRKRMEKGEFNAASLPYGYFRENGIIKINENEAFIVEYIFTRYIAGSGMESIAKDLNRSIDKGGKCDIWCKNTVRYILTNEKYTGKAIFQKYYTPNAFPFRQRENKGEMDKYIVENAMPVIIRPKTFDLAQNIYQSHLKASNRTKGGTYPLSGLIKCGCCGSTYRRKIINGIVSWTCITHNLNADKCTSMPVSEERIYSAFINMCNKLQQNYRHVLIPLQQTLRELNTRQFRGDAGALELHKEIAALKDQKHVLANLRTKGFLDEQKYAQQVAEAENKIVKKQRELSRKAKNEENDNVIEQIDMIIDFFEKRTDIMTEPEPAALECLVDRITITGNSAGFEITGSLKLKEQL